MQKKWLAVWGVASCIAPPTAAQYAKDITLRTTIRVNVGGTAVRIRLANPGTDSPVEIERATVFNLSNDAAPVAFNASPIHIPGRGTVESNPIEMNVKPGDDLVVSLYLKEMTHLMSGVRVNGPLSRMAFSEGDTSMMRDPGALNITDTDAVRLLTELDVETEDDAHAIIAYGDSITAQSWPDYLALRLEREKKNATVVRRGISGNRVLREYTSLHNRHYGIAGLKRFEDEIQVSGADRVIVLHGVNDIIHPDGVNPCRPWSDLPTAEQLIDGLRKYIEIAHRCGKKIYVSTITPINGWSTYLPLREELRGKVNEWIRTSGEADGVIDFAAAVCSADDPTHLDPACDSGDHLHPSLEGARRMAESIPDSMLD